MDKMSQLKLLEKTDYIKINEFRMDFEELELQLMPAMQRGPTSGYQTCSSPRIHENGSY